MFLLQFQLGQSSLCVCVNVFCLWLFTITSLSKILQFGLLGKSQHFHAQIPSIVVELKQFSKKDWENPIKRLGDNTFWTFSHVVLDRFLYLIHRIHFRKQHFIVTQDLLYLVIKFVWLFKCVKKVKIDVWKVVNTFHNIVDKNHCYLQIIQIPTSYSNISQHVHNSSKNIIDHHRYKSLIYLDQCHKNYGKIITQTLLFLLTYLHNCVAVMH